jgi:hypothetical protein
MNRNSSVRAALFVGLAFLSVAASAADPSPALLAAITLVEVTSKSCHGGAISSKTVEESSLLNALVGEFTDLRLSVKGVYAAKISCSTMVQFYSHGRLVSTFHVFGCKALEVANVPGKRYFEYKQGMNALPQFAGLVGTPTTGNCR